MSRAGSSSGGAPRLVVGTEDFDAAAARLCDARERGWRISAVIVHGDHGVLIGNRFDRSLPIVDEVHDAAQLPFGALAAVEVAEAGASISLLSDPLRLGLLLGFVPEEARAARTTARAVAGCRSAIVVRTARSLHSRQRGDAAVILVGPDGAQQRLNERADPPAPGRIAALRLADGERDQLLYVVWRSLPSPPDDPGFARRLARERAIAIALLGRRESGDLLTALSELCAKGARVVARESDAAMLGAATTPGAGRAPFILDLGGGTVDRHRAEGAVHAPARHAGSPVRARRQAARRPAGPACPRGLVQTPACGEATGAGIQRPAGHGRGRGCAARRARPARRRLRY